MAQSLIVERQVEISDTTNDDGENVNSVKSQYLMEFEPIALLGIGGDGVVFKAKKKFDNCNYAIKRIAFSNSQDSEEHVMREVNTLTNLDHSNIVRQDSEERVMREVNALTNLDHSNIVRYFNSWLECPPSGWQEEHDQQWLTNEPGCPADLLWEIQPEIIDSLPLDLNKKFLYIQMQLCQFTLKEWLMEHTSERDTCEVLNIFEQIVDAVEYVHNKKLIHRDLKPTNIFFAYDGKIKVGDFSLVTTMTDDCDTAHALVRTTDVGTNFYKAPEINRKHYDYKVDIYSLGIILFELFTPFSTEMERDIVLSNVKKSTFPKCFVEMYPDMYNLLLMMLNEDSTKRPDTSEIKKFMQNYTKDISPENVKRVLVYPFDSFLRKTDRYVIRPAAHEIRRVFRRIRKVIR